MFNKEEIPILSDIQNRQDFQEKVYPNRRPVILRGVDLGKAPFIWTPEHLAERCGEKPVKVHVCPVEHMAFVQKNFLYKLALLLVVVETPSARSNHCLISIVTFHYPQDPSIL